MSSPDITQRLAATGQLLVRSGIEIGRILDSMLEDHSTLTARLRSEVMFLSQLLYVEPVKGYMLLSYSDHKPANAAALAEPKLTLRCNHRGAQFAFSGSTPKAVVHSGKPCIQCELPTIMLAMQQRRVATRVTVPAQAPVSCEVRMGVLTFDAKVVDVSLDGIGTLVSDPTIPLCAGTRLEHARIRHPQHTPIEVDLEIRYVTQIKLPTGERASRIGCKIVSSAANLEELIRLFIIDLQ
ncbi:MAG TPA: flagellar regulator YcgR PilZN domain-containing protein [Burkholderiales bacterium]|nr:flagellar regulator YcgR PilZN domain-containing protein [Burkholderiales bacterium]